MSPHNPKSLTKGFSISSNPGSKAVGHFKPLATSTLGKRPRAALHHESDDDDDERPVKHEIVTGFDIGGAVFEDGSRKEKAILVIPKMKNKDWREELRKQKRKNTLPAEVQARIDASSKGEHGLNGVNDVLSTPGSESKWGLAVQKKGRVSQRNSEEPRKLEVDGEVPVSRLSARTEDERAIDALMGINEKEASNLIIPVATTIDRNERTSGRANEEDTYRKAIREAPDVSTLEDYERVPVEDFGAALLRGMGWKEGAKVDKPKEVKRRPNRLGLGAKQLENPEELGGWVQNPKSRHADRKPRANEYREKRDRERDRRDERYGSHRRGRDDLRQRESDRERERDIDRRH